VGGEACRAEPLGVSPSWPQPNRAVHKQFVLAEGWDDVESTHHDTYELVLPNGDVLRTRISRPPSRKHTYGRGMWAHILRDQLAVTEPEFWACVNDGELPDRGAAARHPRTRSPSTSSGCSLTASVSPSSG